MNLELESLNLEQRRAVTHVNGRLLILAGAGSGKTRVLTMRMAYLIRSCGVSPKNILGLTFTNKAAEEMRHRMGSLIDKKSAKQVTLSTFHSLCMQILRKEIHHLGYTPHFSLYDEKDLQRLITSIIRDITGIQGELPSLEPTLYTLQKARNQGLQPEQIQGTGSDWHDKLSQDLYSKLQVSLRAYNAVDFDHLLTLTVEIFERFPVILDKYQELFRYIMIDEYQDTNPVQYRLAELLSSKYNNLCVVGDDDQSIYGWRGADVSAILNFRDAEVVTLEQNYRSTNTILKAANTVIAHNKNRHEKALWSQKGEGQSIEIFHAPTAVQEAEAVVARLNTLREKRKLTWNDIAILYRSNSIARPFETALLKQLWCDSQGKWNKGIPYQIVGGQEFYQRREIKDLLCYLRIIVNPQDQEALLRVINVPRRGIGESTLDLLTAYNRKTDVPLWQLIETVIDPFTQIPLAEQIGSKALGALNAFFLMVQSAKELFKKESLPVAMRSLLDTIRYKKAIEEEVKSEQMRAFKWSNVEEFIQSMEEFSTSQNDVAERFDQLVSFVANTSLDDKWDNSEGNNRNVEAIKLMTFHGAKGLEFPACFLVGLEDHIIPHEKSLKDTGLEEERRLMYVALTRAKEHLTISMATQRSRMGKEESSKPSRFLFDIPKELLKVTDWENPIPDTV
ncbi:MAG: UvrD-helicase domain-containing protein [Parachlamydiales bacterium]|jgi:superfamily I DNA/RNA helicase